MLPKIRGRKSLRPGRFVQLAIEFDPVVHPFDMNLLGLSISTQSQTKKQKKKKDSPFHKSYSNFVVNGPFESLICGITPNTAILQKSPIGEV
jgi:hypothetical protein